LLSTESQTSVVGARVTVLAGQKPLAPVQTSCGSQ
jgi:hypothetical protein